MESVTLHTAGGKAFENYVARPEEGTPLHGCVVVLHEAFGVTDHIKRVCDDFAGQGYVALAPAMHAFSVGKPEGVVLPVNKAGLDEARQLIGRTAREDIVALVAACVAWAAEQGLKAGLCGFCWGGSVAYLGASHVPGVAACISYYGGQMAQLAAEAQPTCPTLVHLAAHDRYIPLDEARESLAANHPAAQVQIFDADHGFNRDDGVSYDPGVALVARRMTLDVLEKALR